jgi:hypothetical protein
MDMFQNIIDNNLLDLLTERLKSRIGNTDIYYKKMPSCIMFFIGGSSILQIIPDNDERLTYANHPEYQDEIREVIESFKTMINRSDKIDQIIKKESD